MTYNYSESDEFLWRLATGGDAEAEEELLKRYSVLVRIQARRYFLSGGDGEDLIQEGMLGLLSAVRHFNPEKETAFKTYAELCIKNRLVSAIKMASGAKHSPLNDYISFESPQFTECQSRLTNSIRDPEELIISREGVDFIQESLQKLLSKFESQILAYYLEGLSYSEISAKVGKPEKSVDNAVQRIRKKLQRP